METQENTQKAPKIEALPLYSLALGMCTPTPRDKRGHWKLGGWEGSERYMHTEPVECSLATRSLLSMLSMLSIVCGLVWYLYVSFFLRHCIACMLHSLSCFEKARQPAASQFINSATRQHNCNVDKRLQRYPAFAWHLALSRPIGLFGKPITSVLASPSRSCSPPMPNRTAFR